jgi:thymidylate synthase
MEFIPLYYKNKLELVNPSGDVGVVSLWSPVNAIQKHFQNANIDLSCDSSRIAVFGTLYGEGLPELLRNLLYNPQLRYLVLFGVDLGTSRESLKGFFENGLELTDCLGAPVHQIIGTNRKLDGEVQPDDFHKRLQLVDLGTPKEPGLEERIKGFFKALPGISDVEHERLDIPIPKIAVARSPSDPSGHNIIANTPLAAWKELVHRLFHFGYKQTLKKGIRVELQNVKVTIKEPREESEAALKEHGFSLDDFISYQKSILSPALPPDQEYGYGNRIRGYFGKEKSTYSPDTLSKAVELLKKDPESRHVYISLWDTARDLLSDEKGHPCLISLFFRKFEGRLTMTAVFRTHNALRAWIENLYGLIAIQRFVADGSAIPPGAITIMSHSISIAPQGNGLTQAETVCAFRDQELQAKFADKERLADQDPNGDFLISVDDDALEIILEHRFEGQQIKRYTGSSAEELEQQIVSDVAISKISHALYLGRELGRAETRLKSLERKKR